MPKSIFILPNFHLPFKPQALSEDWPRWMLPALPPEIPTPCIPHEPADVLGTGGRLQTFLFARSLPLLGTTCISTYVIKKLKFTLANFPHAQSTKLLPWIKDDHQEMHKLMMACLLYDLSFRNYMPSQLWICNSIFGQFLSVSSSFLTIQKLGLETVNHFTFWII